MWRQDVALTIAWGLNFMRNERMRFDWAAYPDDEVTGLWGDIFWNGALIHRELIWVVSRRQRSRR